jgi:hypothetical protein
MLQRPGAPYPRLGMAKNYMKHGFRAFFLQKVVNVTFLMNVV